MKAIYNTRMKEYVTELTFISEKLKKYDDILQEINNNYIKKNYEISKYELSGEINEILNKYLIKILSIK